ncbi:hypothetical protein A2O21_07605 [Listeria monocytogenes]|uniref:hypothetical protein n=1 Tax=Listeria TaxID=1637 RepID=UPI0010EF466D|nr:MULTISPECIES: hypothetical protein [Listeria]EAD6317675.1 hypothetical protein [Listeria monocytogenes]EAF8952461.1 hypothetical protein [Listeria monocytogenes]EAF8959039.1 hypothetical protein [Listeria monocytogenes]EAF8961934.1 hypothetical protein [Listeria monocytogenes]EAF8983605.1 hypothetical protein [Listeria monocytogenes]
MKIVLNKCYGGFGLSIVAEFRLCQLKGVTPRDYDFDIYSEKDRGDLDLIATIEELGKTANGSYSDLKIVEIPDGSDFIINDYDGIETVVYGTDIGKA